ncbi:uncharacterized protein LOC133778850 [Humulus lupulus]|uniref:uncharacterized protein LOC133778850 n=1 Tax=Humulus lupulus TaxID=3486 RepID=UPI002B408F86|nr:uncharacterized protein LOC133778850 [Humulus lupulus]
MESRAALLTSMFNATKSVKNLITDANLRLAGLKGSPPATSEPAAGGAHDGVGREQGPEQQPQSPPPRRRPTGVTIREPAAPHRAAELTVPKGKGKQKAVEPAEQFDDSSDVYGTPFSFLNNLPILIHLFDGNGNFRNAPSLNLDFFQELGSSVENVPTSMDSGDFFAHYQAAAEASAPKKDSKRARGESSKTPAKKARTEDAPADAPSREDLTHPPAPEQQTPAPANPRPSSKGFLSLTASWRQSGAMVSRERNFDARLAQAMQALEDEKAKLLEENKELAKLNE